MFVHHLPILTLYFFLFLLVILFLFFFFYIIFLVFFFFFFFQAEDGIRDLTVTGVQTCALPIFFRRRAAITACRPDTSCAARCSTRSGELHRAPRRDREDCRRSADRQLHPTPHFASELDSARQSLIEFTKPLSQTR